MTHRYDRALKFSSLVKGGRISAQWRPPGRTAFVYLCGRGAERRLVEVDPTYGEQATLLEESRLRSVLRGVGYDAVGVDLLEQVVFSDDGTAIRLVTSDRLWELNLQDHAIRELGTRATRDALRANARLTAEHHPSALPASYETPSPQGNLFLRIESCNLWLRDIADDQPRPLTFDGVERHGWGKNLYTMSTHHAWSPDGAVVATFKVDGRQTHYMPVLHWLGQREKVSHHLYAPAGGTLPSLELHFIDVATGERVTPTLGADATYFRPAGWHPNGLEFLFFWLSRDGKRIELRSTHRKTGHGRILWAEKASTFVTSPSVFLLAEIPAFRMLSDCRFIVASERSGWNHLYLYGPANRPEGESELLVQLTCGEFPVREIVEVDEKRGFVYLTARCDPIRIYDTHLMRVRLDGTALCRLTDATGEHQIQMSPAMDCFLDTHSTITRPPVTELRRSDGSLVSTLDVGDTRELEQTGWRSPEELVVKASDGQTELHGIIRFPSNFDARKRYPVIECIYGGPQVAIVPRTFVLPESNMIMTFANALAQLGYIVVSVDARGTPDRSKAFQDAVYQNWGRHEIADHATALRNAACDRPYMDLNRVGVFGHSYGGYFATRALLQAPDLYKVGVALAPATQLNTIFALASENYFGGRPQDVPELYEYASNLRLADRLEGKLLLVHPTSDVNAPLAHAMQFVEALARAGKDCDLKLIPEGDHVFRNADSVEGRWREMARDYFLTHLPPEAN